MIRTSKTSPIFILLSASFMACTGGHRPQVSSLSSSASSGASSSSSDQAADKKKNDAQGKQSQFTKVPEAASINGKPEKGTSSATTSSYTGNISGNATGVPSPPKQDEKSDGGNQNDVLPQATPSANP